MFNGSAGFTTEGSDILLEQLLDRAKRTPLLLKVLAAVTMTNAKTVSQRDSKLRATCVAISTLMTARNQRYPGLAKIIGLICALGGVSENIHELLNRARIACSHRTAVELLDARDYAKEIKQVCLLACVDC